MGDLMRAWRTDKSVFFARVFAILYALWLSFYVGLCLGRLFITGG